MEELVLGIGLLALGLGASISAYIWSGEGASNGAPSQASPPPTVLVERVPVTVTKVVTVPTSSRSSASSAPSSAEIGKALAGTAEPFARPLAAGVLRIAGEAVRTGVIDIATPQRVQEVATGGVTGSLGSAFANPSRDAAGSVLTEASSDALGVSNVAVGIGKNLVSLRGESVAQQKATLGRTVLEAVQGAATAIPFVGAGVSAALGALAQTGEGKHLVAAVGTSAERVYTAQKEILKGDVSAGFTTAADALTGGGFSHQERESAFFLDVDKRVAELKAGGGKRPGIDHDDLNGFQQSIAYGHVMVLGFDLRAVVKDARYRLGGNPFLPAGASPSAISGQDGAAIAAQARDAQDRAYAKTINFQGLPASWFENNNKAAQEAVDATPLTANYASEDAIAAAIRKYGADDSATRQTVRSLWRLKSTRPTGGVDALGQPIRERIMPPAPPILPPAHVATQNAFANPFNQTNRW